MNPNSFAHRGTLIEHNVYKGTDQLYDPIRSVLFNPENIRKH
jgi:hypothetical protein